ncbi:MAG: hypothetical protein IPM23_16555 [Candidatus Melainabacteria bacterium]|nr:hypothetical protein [Candidatus Melainabacteria bacterium]
MQVIARTSRVSRTASKGARLATIATVLAILLVILAHILLHPLLIPAEAAVHLQGALLMVNGKLPYADFFVLSSPAMLYLLFLPAAVSELINIHPVLVFNLFVFVILLLSLLGCKAVLLDHKSRDQASAPYFLICFAALSLLFISEFGQAHHLLMLLTIPYFLCRKASFCGQILGPRLLVACGAAAGIGFSLEPLFALLFIATELVWWVEKQSLKPFSSYDFTSCALVLAIYLSHFIMIPAPMSSLYAALALPLLMYDYKHWWDILSYVDKTPDRRDLVYFMIVAVTVALGLRKWCSLIVPMVVIAVASFGIFIFEGHMLTFQAIPFVYGAALAAALALGAVLNWICGIFNQSLPARAIAVAAGLAALGGIFYQWSQLSGVEYLSLSDQGYPGNAPKSDLANFAEQILKETRPGDRVLVLNPRARPAYPLLLQLGRKPASCGLLTAEPLSISERITPLEPPETAGPLGYHMDMVLEKLDKDLSGRDRPALVLYDQETMGVILENRGLKDKILKYYAPIEMADWNLDKGVHPAIEYLGFKYPLNVLKLKPEFDSRSGKTKKDR